jgi:hypothetical protein
MGSSSSGTSSELSGMEPLLGHHSPVLETLVELYAESTAGKTGTAARDFGEPYQRLLKRAKATSGAALTLAEMDVQTAERAGALKIERNRRSRDPERVRVSLANEARLFELLGRMSPTTQRRAWADMFENTAKLPVPAKHQADWIQLCQRRGKEVLVGKGVAPFRWGHRRQADAQLQIVAELLGWDRPCFVRTVSAQLSGSSKFFERCLTTLESLLSEASGGAVRSLHDLNIKPNPTKVRFHGAIRLHLRGSVKNYEGFHGESALSELDLAAADAIEFDGARCVTIENTTTFHEVCSLDCKDLLVFTSYPNQATINFLKRLPKEVQLHHWGDTDPWGFDVLRDLRRKTGRLILPLHMHFGCWAESLPVETRARRVLTSRDRARLADLLANEEMIDVREELEKMDATGITGDFEQEGLLVASPAFPYLLIAR